MKSLSKTVVVIACLALLAPLAASAFQFDPGGTIGTSLGLPKEDAQSVVIRVIQYVLGFLGLIAVILILFGGFRYLTSAGNQEAIDSAKKILRSAVIGLLIVLLSQALFLFIVSLVQRVTS